MEKMKDASKRRASSTPKTLSVGKISEMQMFYLFFWVGEEGMIWIIFVSSSFHKIWIVENFLFTFLHLTFESVSEFSLLIKLIFWIERIRFSFLLPLSLCLCLCLSLSPPSLRLQKHLNMSLEEWFLALIRINEINYWNEENISLTIAD